MRINIQPSVKNKKKLRFDRSVWILILSNLFVIALAVYEKWDIGVLMWIYWSQSVAIGILNFLKIINLRNFTTDGFTINGRSVELTPSTKLTVAFFFLIHFLINHAISLFIHWKEEVEKKQNIGNVMFAPYSRIIPMHLTIIFGSIIAGSRGTSCYS